MVRTGRVRGLTCGDCAVVAPGQVPSGSVVDPVEDASALVWARFTPSIRSSSAEHQTRVAPPQASRQVGDFRREPRDRDGGRGTAAPFPGAGPGAEVLSLVERGLYQGFRPGEPGLEDLPLQHRSVRGDPHETVRRVHPQELLEGGLAE